MKHTHLLLALLCVFVGMCGTMAAQPAPSPTKQAFTSEEVAELRDTFKTFSDCWYRKRDAACFWSHVAKDSPYRGVDEMVSERMYSGAFVFSDAEAPNASSFVMTIGQLPEDFKRWSQENKVRIGCENAQASADGFCVLLPSSRLNDLFWNADVVAYMLAEMESVKDTSPDLSDLSPGEKARVVTRSQRAAAAAKHGYAMVFYLVEGQGYTNEFMTTLWVREQDTWKLLAFFGSD